MNIDIQPKDTSRGHFYVSLGKSFLRIIAGITLALAGLDPDVMTAWLKCAGAFFIAAEVLGIVEEIV
jgi:hypothetical protein